MECGGDYVNKFIQYVDSFVANIRPDDPLPVRAPSYKVTETEIDGQIIDIVYHYLSGRECPAYVRSLVAHRVWSAIRNPEPNGRDDDEGCDVIDHGGNQTYEPMKLIQEVTSRANGVLREFQKSLSPSVVESLPRFLPVSQYAIKNTRRKMEDRHVMIQDLNTLYGLNLGYPHAYYGVFDGHAGTDAAVYSAALLHQYLMQNPLYEIDPINALKHAFHITDTNFSKKAEKERLKGGTTAVVALVREKRLVVAWLGDSLALLVRKRTPVHIVEPHKPELMSERKRIDDAGGFVVNIQGTWRVLGQLAVSRAIGDVQYKPYVTSECDIKSLEISGDEDFLILACDGLWDNLTPENAVNIVYSYLLRNDGDTDGVGRCLVEAARSAGSEDNITAIVVFLRPVNVLMEEETARVAQGQVPEMDSFVMTQKDSLPPSINAIFSPPENFTSPSPSAEVTKEANGLENLLEEHISAPLEARPPPSQDYDSDEGVGADISVEKVKDFPEAEANPTDAEVDAVLAELDAGCEAGDLDEDDDDDEEEWAYFKTEPQKQNQQTEDLLAASSEVPVDSIAGSEQLPQNSRNIENPQVFPSDFSPTGSPPAPSSPRTVEGFVTSVELNTPEESYNTNLAINQSTEYFNGGQIEQSSGPFSVYVSSSPEPGSIDSPPLIPHSPFSPNVPAMEISKDDGEDFEDDRKSSVSRDEPENVDEPSVEIVHAQSTVEVLTDVRQEEEILMEEEEAATFIPDIMTQSITGDLPTEPYNPFEVIEDAQLSLENVREKERVGIHTDEQFVIGEGISSLVPSSLSEDAAADFSPDVFEGNIPDELNQVERAVINNESYLSALPELSMEAKDADQQISHELLENQFTNQVNRAFVAPLEEMMASFHEERIPEVSAVPPPALEDEATLEPSPPHISSAQFFEDEMNMFTDKVSQLLVEETMVESQIDKPPVVEPPVIEVPLVESSSSVAETPMKETSDETEIEISKPEPKKPLSAPRTSLRTAPPKPSPRLVGNKQTGVSTANAAGATTKAASKRPTSLLSTSSSKPLRKPETAKSSPGTASSTNPRVSTSTLTTKASLASAAAKPKTTVTKTATKTTVLSSKPKSNTIGGTTAPKAGVPSAAVPNKPKTTSPAVSPAPRRLTLAPKPASAASTTLSAATTASRITTTSKISNGVGTFRTTTKPSTTTTATTRLTNLVASKRPAATKTTTARTTSATTTRKPQTVAANKTTTTTTTIKQRAAVSAPPSTKDSKNTTNRMLSSTKSSTATKTSPQTASRTSTAATKTRTIVSKTTKTTGLKTKKESDGRPTESKQEPDAVANGENKIVEEESSVEVKEKILEEVRMEAEVEELIDVESSMQDGHAMKENILVNGDH